jgi:hypothetical protein
MIYELGAILADEAGLKPWANRFSPRIERRVPGSAEAGGGPDRPLVEARRTSVGHQRYDFRLACVERTKGCLGGCPYPWATTAASVLP